MNNPFQPIGSKAIGELAAIGSSTAKALLQQMNQEAREAEEQRRQLAMASKQVEATERSKKVALLNEQVHDALLVYEEHRKKAHDALMHAFKASFDFPFDTAPREQFDFLRKVHMPPAKPDGMAELFPVFTSTECAISEMMAAAAKR